jgi:two-component system phosphate regulon sensor histidine kinase PhoR
MLKSSTNRLIATVIGTILLPLIIYSVAEISSVKEDEEMIEKIYRDQLDAIIFSINQFSNDNISGLLDKVEKDINPSLEFNKNTPYLKYSNIVALVVENLSTNQSREIRIFGDSSVQINWKSLRDSVLSLKPNLKTQLIRYKEGGYRKIEPQGTIMVQNDRMQVVHAVLENSEGQSLFVTAFISIYGFANNVLAPKLQQIAEGDLIITLGYRGQEDYVYVTDTISKEVILSKSMWLIPDLDVGISSANKTVSELVSERTQYNLTTSFILILLLIFGFSLVIRNIRGEMILAQTKSDFVSNVSHELRTPLSLISMFAETLLLDRVNSPEKRKEYEEIIFKETNRLTNIVNKILNFSQIEAAKRVYNPTSININDLVNELMHDYAYHVERNGFTYEIHLTEDLPKIEIDREALYEALVNLIDNSIKYSPNEKFLSICTGQKENAVWVEVTDHGMGIPTDRVKMIFDKFYRVTEGNVQSTRGAGLGLALVSHIVDSHGGDIEVESTPGKGSTFRLIFYLNSNG